MTQGRGEQNLLSDKVVLVPMPPNSSRGSHKQSSLRLWDRVERNHARGIVHHWTPPRHAVSTFVAVNRLLMSPIRNTRHQHRPLPSPFSLLLPIYLPSLSFSSPFRDSHPYNQRVNRPCRKRDYYLDNRKINCKMRRFTLPACEVMVILITYLLLPDYPLSLNAHTKGNTERL